MVYRTTRRFRPRFSRKPFSRFRPRNYGSPRFHKRSYSRRTRNSYRRSRLYRTEVKCYDNLIYNPSSLVIGSGYLNDYSPFNLTMPAQGVGDDEFIGNSFIIKCIMVYLSMYSPSSTDPVPVAEGRSKWMIIVLKDYRKITNLDPNNIHAPDPPLPQDIFELDPYPATTPYDPNDHNSVARWLQIMPLKKGISQDFRILYKKTFIRSMYKPEME